MDRRPPAFSCPLPLRGHTSVQLAHGGGGRRMRELLDEIVLPAFANEALAARHDSAVLAAPAGRLAFTTDTYVVSPRVFPGGDIGSLAVTGTANDLAMAGARPAWLSAALVVEEGFAVEELRAVIASMRDAAARCAVEIVTGDTKVVDRGKGDGLFVNTAGIGVVGDGIDVRPARVRPGDAVLVSGDVGRHGIAVLSRREGLAFETPVASDCAPLWPLVAGLVGAGVDVHCLRDPTRGGLATVVNEIALDAAVGVELDEAAIPVDGAVAAACELLGLDPLYVACEGRLVAFVPGEAADATLAALHAGAPDAAVIGRVTDGAAGVVTLRTALGGRRLLDLLSGEQLPRIC